MKLNIAFSVQSGCLNLLSLSGSASLPRIRNIRSAACLQTAILSLNKSICAFATRGRVAHHLRHEVKKGAAEGRGVAYTDLSPILLLRQKALHQRLTFGTQLSGAASQERQCPRPGPTCSWPCSLLRSSLSWPADSPSLALPVTWTEPLRPKLRLACRLTRVCIHDRQRCHVDDAPNGR